MPRNKRELRNLLRIVGAAAVFLLLVAGIGLVFAQDGGATSEPAKAAVATPGNWGWVLDLGAPGVLGAVLLALWRYYRSQNKDHKEERKAWSDEKLVLSKGHVTEKANLAKDHEREKAELVKDHEREKTELVKDHDVEKERVRSEAKAEKQAMREAFEEEKSEMREVYTGEISAMRTRMDAEQKERREETAALWKQNNDTTREVMSVTKELVLALQQNSELMRLVKEQFDVE